MSPLYRAVALLALAALGGAVQAGWRLGLRGKEDVLREMTRTEAAGLEEMKALAQTSDQDKSMAVLLAKWKEIEPERAAKYEEWTDKIKNITYEACIPKERLPPASSKGVARQRVQQFDLCRLEWSVKNKPKPPVLMPVEKLKRLVKEEGLKPKAATLDLASRRSAEPMLSDLMDSFTFGQRKKKEQPPQQPQLQMQQMSQMQQMQPMQMFGMGQQMMPQGQMGLPMGQPMMPGQMAMPMMMPGAMGPMMPMQMPQMMMMPGQNMAMAGMQPQMPGMNNFGTPSTPGAGEAAKPSMPDMSFGHAAIGMAPDH